MVRRSKPKMFRHNGRQPLDAQVLRYIVMNESGRCAPEKLLYTFQEFRNEAQVLEWIENLGTAVKRQLVEFKANEVRACLNGIQVCKTYGFHDRCNGECTKIHICCYHLKGFCTKKGNCQQSHDLKNEHNNRILFDNHLGGLDYRVVFKALRYMFRWNKVKPGSNDPDDALSVVSEVESVATLDGMVSDIEDLDEVEIFRRILNDYGGRCDLSTFIIENQDLGTETELTQFFEDIEENDDDWDWFKVEAGSISLHLVEMRVCPKYKRKTSCQNQSCNMLHLCTFGVLGSCGYGAKCKFYHRLKSGPNERIIKALEDDGFTEEDLIQYLKLKLQQKSGVNVDDDDSDAVSIMSDMSSTSGSCWKTDRSEIVHYILKLHNGCCSYSDLTVNEKFGFKNTKEVINFIKGKNGKERFTIVTREGRELVRVTLPGAEICPNYKTKAQCQKNTCEKFHLCSYAVKGKCAYKRCKYHHDLLSEHNRNAMRHLGLSDIKDADILLYLKLQLEGNGRKQGAVASNLVEDAQSQCEKPALATLGDKIEQIDKKHIPSLMDFPLPVDVNLKRRKEVLNALLQFPDGCCSLAQLQTRVRDEFSTTTDLLTWLTSPMGKKICAVQQALTPHDTLVMLYVQVFQICFDYYSSEGCRDPRCTFFHICRNFVAGVCKDVHCSYSHDTRNDHNERVLRKSGLSFSSSNDIISAIKYSSPSVCIEHNASGGCKKTATCRRFHICANYLQFRCQYPTCKKSHDLKDTHNTRLIKTLGISDKLVFKTLQIASPSHEVQCQASEIHMAKSKVIPDISQPTMILCLLRDVPTEEVMVEQLKTFECLRQFTSMDILYWLTSSKGQEVCRVLPAKSPDKHLVKLSVKSLQMCFGYYGKQGCQKENCGFLHLCREHVAGCCERRNCKYSHDVGDTHNMEVLQKTRLGLEYYLGDEVLELITRSTPQVCPEHNSPNRCRNPVCMKFHLCADKVRHRCSVDTCPKGHTLQTPHNRSLLQIYDTPENVMYMMLIVRISKGDNAQDRRRPREKEKKTIAKQERNPSTKTLCSGPFLENFLKKYDGCCSLLQFTEMCPPDLTLPNVIDIFEDPTVQKYYSITLLGGNTMALAKVKDLDLCFQYFGNQGCSRNKCSYLHLCREYLAGNCIKNARCRFSHNIEDRQNAKVLNDVNVPKGIPLNLLLKLIQNSIPCVCQDHNTSRGCTNEHCFKFHVCSNYLKRSCTRSATECTYGHSLDDARNLKLADLYNCAKDNIKAKVAAADMPKSSILPYHELSQRNAITNDKQSKPSEGNTITSDKQSKPSEKKQLCTQPKLLLSDIEKAPAIPICHDFVAKFCKNSHCGMHHYEIPYLWCISKHGDAWKPFNLTASENIEEQYSNPDINVINVSIHFSYD